MRYSLTGAVLALAVAAGFFIASPAPAAEDSQALFDRVSTDLMCLCGCNATIKTCPHADCGFAIPARARIREMIAGGKTYDDIVASFVGQHGEVIRSAPPKEGFNLVGYAMPFLALAAAGVAVGGIARRWARKGESARAEMSAGAKRAPADPARAALSEKLKNELRDFDA